MAHKSLEALREALRREEEGKAYHQKARDNATNPLGKEMFEFLIRAEGSHIQKIKQIYNALEKSGKWTNIIPKPGKRKSSKRCLRSCPCQCQRTHKSRCK